MRSFYNTLDGLAKENFKVYLKVRVRTVLPLVSFLAFFFLCNRLCNTTVTPGSKGVRYLRGVR
jgi:hypothetical protein